jgi:hypothetical protein
MENLNCEKPERKLLVSRIQTPDGTILTSRYTHDCVFYIDKNGLKYMLDGGNEYQRVIVNNEAPHVDVSIYTDDPYETIREHYCIQIDEEPVPLCNIPDEWLKEKLEMDSMRGGRKNGMLCNMEVSYRKHILTSS